MSAATDNSTAIYSVQAQMILGLLRGFRCRPGGMLVHREDSLDAARVALRRETSAVVVREVRRGLEAMHLAEVVDPDIAQGIGILCDTMLDLLDPCAPRLRGPFELDPRPTPSQPRAPEAHNPAPVRMLPSHGPNGHRLLPDALVREHVIGEGR